jgi:nucleoside-diphosphate-sugar epimerase
MVTGGAGFIGSALVWALNRLNHESFLAWQNYEIKN